MVLAEKYNTNEKLLFIDDFNGHIGSLGEQIINKNGQSLHYFVDKYNLSIMNLDMECEGEITWQQGNMSIL